MKAGKLTLISFLLSTIVIGVGCNSDPSEKPKAVSLGAIVFRDTISRFGQDYAFTIPDDWSHDSTSLRGVVSALVRGPVDTTTTEFSENIVVQVFDLKTDNRLSLESVSNYIFKQGAALVDGGVTVVAMDTVSIAQKDYYLITYDFTYTGLNLRSISCSTVREQKLYCLVYTDLQSIPAENAMVTLDVAMETFEVNK